MKEDNTVASTSNIRLVVGLNKNSIPVKIEWQSDGSKNNKELSECKAFLLSLFDKSTKDTLKIDLWTTEMQVQEMDRLVFQTLRALSDTYNKATGNTALSNEMRKFVQYFGEKTEIIPKAE